MRFTLVALLLLVASVAYSGEAVVRSWISVSGSVIEAEFVSLQLDTVVLRQPDGKMIRIAMNRLSSADQIWVQANRAGAKPQVPEVKEETPLEKLIGDELINAGKDKVAVAGLTHKRLGLYFSAHWCPPCRQFTPVLVDTYNKMKAENKDFEIIFVSRDHDKQSMLGYMDEAQMPWLAVPFNGSRRDKLSETFGVSGIPKLVIIDGEGKIVSTDARGEVTSLGVKAYDKW